MSDKKPLLDNESAKKVIPWEPVGQVDPKDLPDEAPEGYPAPWKTHGRGNGHFDVIAADGTYVAHVYLWDEKDGRIFKEKLRSVNGEGDD